MLEDISRENSIGGPAIWELSGPTAAQAQPLPCGSQRCHTRRPPKRPITTCTTPRCLQRAAPFLAERGTALQPSDPQQHLQPQLGCRPHTHAGTPLTQHSPIPVFHTQSTPFKRRLPTRTHRAQRRAGHHRAHKVPTGRALTARHGTAQQAPIAGPGGSRGHGPSAEHTAFPYRRCPSRSRLLPCAAVPGKHGAGYGQSAQLPAARDGAGCKSAERV